jgi:hypothetical protein
MQLDNHPAYRRVFFAREKNEKLLQSYGLMHFSFV